MDESEIRELKIVDLVNSFPAYGRLTKSINRAAQEDTLPFETVGEMLDAGSKQTHKKLQAIDGIGPRAADQFHNLLRRYVPENLFVAFEDRKSSVRLSQNHNQNLRGKRQAKRLDGTEKGEEIVKELDSKFPGVFIPLVEAYAEASEGERTKREKLEKKARNLLHSNREQPYSSAVLWAKLCKI